MQDRFKDDNFTSRRTTGHNMFDPESLMSGAEAEQGMTYENSHRVFPDTQSEDDAVTGRIDTDTILKIAPRRFKEIEQTGDHYGMERAYPAIAGDSDYGR